jgi:hypothetical protein
MIAKMPNIEPPKIGTVMILTVGLYEIPGTKHKAHIKKLLKTIEEFSTIAFDVIVIPDLSMNGNNYQIQEFIFEE